MAWAYDEDLVTASREALEIFDAHARYRAAIGTRLEDAALAYLRAVVERVKRGAR